MFKTIKSNEINGFISARMKSAKSITFCGDVADAKRIRIIGEVEVSGAKVTNPYIENLDGAVVQYHHNSEDGAIATVYFVDGIYGGLIADIQNYVISDFEVDVEVCPCCGR